MSRLQARDRLLGANKMAIQMAEMSAEELALNVSYVNAACEWLDAQGEGTRQIGKLMTAKAYDVRPAAKAFHWLSSMAPESVNGFRDVYAIHDMVKEIVPGRDLRIEPSSALLAWSAVPLVNQLDRVLDHTKDVLLCLHDPLVVFSWTTMFSLDLPGAAQTVPKIDPLVVALKKLKVKAEMLVPDKIVLVFHGARPFTVRVLPPEHEHNQPEEEQGDML